MKKYLLFFISICLAVVTGCTWGNLDNTPTKRVEKVLNDYKTKDEKVLTQLDNVINADTTMTTEQKSKYKDLLIKQYTNMMYEIKDEVIDGDSAVVTVQIDVTDYYKAIAEADTYLTTNASQFKNAQGVFDNSLFMDYKLNKIENATESVTYTIDFNVEKVDGQWQVENISDIDREKIHGLYAY